jgi:hypothetical protein
MAVGGDSEWQGESMDIRSLNNCGKTWWTVICAAAPAACVNMEREYAQFREIGAQAGEAGQHELVCFPQAVAEED